MFKEIGLSHERISLGSLFKVLDMRQKITSFLGNLYEFFNDSNLHLSFSSGVKPR